MDYCVVGEQGSNSLVEVDEDSLLKFIEENSIPVEGGKHCTICGVVVSKGMKNIKRHFKELHLEKHIEFFCPWCERVYRTRNSFSVHVIRTHPDMRKVDRELFKRLKVDHVDEERPSVEPWIS